MNLNWDKDKSLLLSKVCVYLFMALMLVICAGAPWILTRFFTLARHGDMLPFYLATVYSFAVPAAAILAALWKLLRNLGKSEVFVASNVGILRRMSWYCIAGGIIFLASGLYDWIFFLFAAAAAFIGLILRVVKNVFAEAIAIKSENDFTI